MKNIGDLGRSLSRTGGNARKKRLVVDVFIRLQKIILIQRCRR